MEKSNLSDSQTNIYDVKSNNQILLLYNNPIQGLPSNIIYEHIDNINNINLVNYKHIILQDLLDFLSIDEINSLLKTIYEKIQQDSKIEIQSLEFKQLCIAVANEDINENIAKNILYSRKTVNSIYEIENYIKLNGFKIDTKKYINIFEYNITGIK